MSRRSNNYRRKTLAKLFVSMLERKKIATVSRVFVRENKQFSSVFSMEIIRDYSLTFCKVSRWFPVTHSTWISHELTERSLFLNCDAQVSPLFSESAKHLWNVFSSFLSKSKRTKCFIALCGCISWEANLILTLILVSAPRLPFLDFMPSSGLEAAFPTLSRNLVAFQIPTATFLFFPFFFCQKRKNLRCSSNFLKQGGWTYKLLLQKLTKPLLMEPPTMHNKTLLNHMKQYWVQTEILSRYIILYQIILTCRK